jgi:hypothetical protein
MVREGEPWVMSQLKLDAVAVNRVGLILKLIFLGALPPSSSDSVYESLLVK